MSKFGKNESFTPFNNSMPYYLFTTFYNLKNRTDTILHPWYGGYLTNINAYEGGVRIKIQVSRRELHTHIHLD